MKVSICGEGKSGDLERRSWDLIVDDGHGPKIPTLPVSIMLGKILDGSARSGARACLGEMSMGELTKALDNFGAKTEVHREVVQPLFRQALKEDFDALPEPVRELHSSFGRAVYKGRAAIKGSHWNFGVGGFDFIWVSKIRALMYQRRWSSKPMGKPRFGSVSLLTRYFARSCRLMVRVLFRNVLAPLPCVSV